MKDKLLVLDDEKSILTSLEHLFEEDYEVFTASDADTALLLAAEHEIAVILSDERMPGASGHEFLRRAREVSNAARVMMSGYADIRGLTDAVNSGQIFAYIAKPWDPIQLKDKIRGALVHFKLIQEVNQERGLLRALMENIPDAIYFKDCQSRFTRVNEACARFVGEKNPAQCIGRSDSDYFGAEEASRWHLEEEQIVTSGLPAVDRIEQLRGPQGSFEWISTTKVPMFDRSGQVSGIAGIARNITTLKNSEGVKAAAAVLRESEARCRELANAMPQIVWTARADGNFDYYNRRWYDYTGMTLAECDGRGWLRALHPEDIQNSIEQWTLSVATGVGFEVEYRFKRASDGVYRWHLGRAVPVFGSNGEIIRWFGTCTDIEDYKQAEREIRSANDRLEARVQLRTDELRDSRELFRSLIDGIKDYAILTLSPEGNVTSWNTGATHMQGYHAGEILGKHFSCFHTEEDVKRNHAERLLNAASAQGQCEEEGWLVRRDGSRYWASILITALYDEAGVVRGFSTVTRDITQRKRGEEQLQQSETKFRALLESAPDAMLIVEDDGIITLVNAEAERLFGYERSELLGEGLERLIPGLQNDRELKGRRKDGVEFPVEIRSSTTKTDQRTWSASAVRDVTDRVLVARELVAARERAEAANRTKSAFLATMSHEIRTPMNAILGMADMLWESHLNADQRDYVEVFRRAGSNLLVLINDILDLSRIEAGHLELDEIEFNLEEAVDQAMELIGLSARSKNIALSCRLAPGLTTSLRGDVSRLRQILINLLGNAVKFTDSGEIVLTVRNHESGATGEIEFTVSDTGIGIDPQQLEVIFDDFTQADCSPTRRYGGTGLGLGISRRLVERMGGRLTATSVLGEGSTFRFTALFKSVSRPQRSIPSELDCFSGRRILVIDDNATNRLILRETLEHWGLISEDCRDPRQAVAAVADTHAKDLPYSLIIIDNDGVQKKGYELATQIREVAPNLPILVLASDTRFGDAERRREIGISGYALKPVRRADLLRLICDCLSVRSEQGGISITKLQDQHGTKSAVGLKILVAEDSPDNRLLIQAYLKGSPHTVTFVGDGKAAVEHFRSGGFDLILMDIQMPIMDGLAAARAVRLVEQQHGLTPIAIIALTANARPEDIELSHDAGCDAHLSKPISKQKLLASIEGHGPRSRFSEVTNARETGVIRIQIPVGFQELTPGYLASRRSEVGEMTQLLEARNYQRLRFLGHNMKGTGESYGFPDLTRIGALMERSSAREDHETLSANLGELTDYLERVEC